MNITQLQNAKHTVYNSLDIPFEKSLKTAYPKNLTFRYEKPGCWGGNADMGLKEENGTYTLVCNKGKYQSNNHYHNSGTDILEIETARDNRLNLASKPLFLLKSWVYNGDFSSMAISYYLFGANEDGSFFLHKVRPSAGEQGLEACRNWIWGLKAGEKVACRQGDLAFIAKSRASGSSIEERTIAIGNHNITAERIKATKHRIYCLNPIALHQEHHSVSPEVKGWYELRLARAWKSSGAD